MWEEQDGVTNTIACPSPDEFAQFFAGDSSCLHPALALNHWHGRVAAKGEFGE